MAGIGINRDVRGPQSPYTILLRKAKIVNDKNLEYMQEKNKAIQKDLSLLRTRQGERRELVEERLEDQRFKGERLAEQRQAASWKSPSQYAQEARERLAEQRLRTSLNEDIYRRLVNR